MEPRDMQSFAADLRYGPGAEMFGELEITEAETELGRLRRRDLKAVLEQAMHRGDRVSVITRCGTYGGEVDYVGNDYVTVLALDAAADIRFERCALRVHRVASGGHTVTGGSRTFKARLAEYAATGEVVTLFAPDLRMTLRGIVTVVAVDHVIVAQPEGSTTIALDLLDVALRHP
jgi:hypothetical protein